jgi:hypothetical protein
VTLAPKGLLIEEQRSNLLTYSQDFSTGWLTVAAAVTTNTTNAPDSTATADTLVPNTASTTHYTYQTISMTSGVSYTMSVYVKASGYNRVMLRESTTLGLFVIFDVVSGTVVSNNFATGTISDAGNGWYRCSMTVSAPATASTVMSVICMNNTGTTYANATFVGDGTSGIFIWGAQLEAGAFATSYIPTVASQVTRAADSASIIGNNFARWYNQTEGTIYANFAGGLGNNPTLVSVSTGVSTNPVSAYRNSASASPSTVFKYRTFNGSTQCDINGTSTSAQKIAFAVKAADYAVSENGATALTQASGLGPATADSLRLGWDAPNGGRYWNGTIQRISYYPRRLANTELTSITS